VDFVQGDAHSLPFPSKSFDIALCHFLLLWVENPFRVLAEMCRLVHPGGTVLAMAEPDYGARVDYPDPLVRLGEYQRQSLRLQGADPFIGRKLAGYFHQAGLVEIECGILGGQWNAPLAREEWESEWKVMESDLQHLAGTDADLEALKNLDWNAWLRGERILYVPTFYAWGRVSG
jgi:SAM-dependent methyltransferase